MLIAAAKAICLFVTIALGVPFTVHLWRGQKVWYEQSIILAVAITDFVALSGWL